MAWKLVKQPNGLFARWSDVTDGFTMLNMKVELLRALNSVGELSKQDGVITEKQLANKIEAAEKDFQPYSTNPGEPLSRWNECLKQAAFIHGDEERVHLLETNDHGVFVTN